jgi:hypothetical protein
MLYFKIIFLLVQKLFFRKEDAVNHFLGERKVKNNNKKNKDAKNIKTETVEIKGKQERGTEAVRMLKKYVNIFIIMLGIGTEK